MRRADHPNIGLIVDVSIRWGAASILILINAEPGDLAASICNARGTGIHDIGLGVDDTAATTARAAALGAEPFAQDLSPGQTAIPSIRAAVCCISRTIRRPWRRCGRPNSTRSGASAGLTRTDHIARSMTCDEMLSWSLFCTSCSRPSWM